jgi:hypothetical protein
MRDDGEQVVSVRVALTGYNGVIRLLGDAERFGLGLVALAMTAALDEAETLQLAAILSLSPGCGLDSDRLAARLSRHPAVTCLEVHDHEAIARAPNLPGTDGLAVAVDLLTTAMVPAEASAGGLT